MHHDPSFGNMNQGNSLGNRPVIRQSKYFRQYESGNETKALLGQSNLIWKTDVVQGVFNGQNAFDADDPHGNLRKAAKDSSDRLHIQHHEVPREAPTTSAATSHPAKYSSHVISSNRNEGSTASSTLPPVRQKQQQQQGPSRNEPDFKPSLVLLPATPAGSGGGRAAQPLVVSHPPKTSAWKTSNSQYGQF